MVSGLYLNLARRDKSFISVFSPTISVLKVG